MQINGNFLKIQKNYLFSDIAKKVAAYKAANPDADVIRLGIGDVTRPLAPAVIDAMHKAVDEMAREETFMGYPPEWGYDFLKRAINENDFAARGVKLADDEIFVSDGAKSDCGNIGDIFSADNTVAVCDPIYPVYVDTNIMGGRSGDLIDGRWSRFIYMPCTADNGFVPEKPKAHADLIYLCYPNNPTGASITREQLEGWVAFALENGSVILYDAAYEAYITTPGVPHSIYEIEGAKKCAIEFRSFSKTAGFTGTRCAYTIIPHDLKASDGTELNALWARRQATKFNGVSYITQRGAEATFSEEGKRQVRETIDFYHGNADIIYNGLKGLGYEVYGGVDSPYVWLKTPEGLSSWEFFDLLLNEVQVVGTPGAGFGPAGEGYFRLTAFGSRENTRRAVERIAKL